MSNNQLRFVILIGLFAIPFVPLLVSSSLFFPYITGKAFVFRLIVELIFACYLILAIRDRSYRPRFSWILGAITIFLVAIGLSDIFAVNSYKAFWSNYERMEGYMVLLHLSAFFLVMGSVLKTKDIWNKLLATSVGASAIMSIYSFFQLAGKIAINQGGVRVDGTLGNASYLGIYMVFHVFFAALLFLRFKATWQRILLAAVAIMDLVVLYFTATRGAILGLIGGAAITFLFLALKADKGSKLKKIAALGILAIAIFAGLFFSLRNTAFIKNSPVMSRFASLSFAEVKTQGRYYIWPMAWKGFLEKPILGWGQEGFNFVFNKYYDPRMYEQEAWFDRAHSTPLDWLIAGGSLGLLSYILIILSLLYYVFKNSADSLSKEEKGIMLGLVAAYLFNNLFVFDQISSYILFFTIIAYLHAHAPETPKPWLRKISERIGKVFDNDKLRPAFEASLLVFTVLIVYFVIYAPWKQNKNLLNILRSNSEGKIETIETYTKPLSGYYMGFSESLEHISQMTIGIAADPKASNELKQGLFNLLDESFKKQLEKSPNDARYRLFYSIFLSRFGWYGRAVEQLREAQKYSPNKQQIYFELTSNLLLDKKYTEAVAASKTAYEFDHSYEEAKFIYGLALLASGDRSASEEIFKGISEARLTFDDRYLSVLLAVGRYNEIVAIAQKRVALDPSNMQHRITLAAVYLQTNRRSEAVQVIEEIIKLEPSFKERGEYYINEIKAGRNP